jgi:hypothetical protein
MTSKIEIGKALLCPIGIVVIVLLSLSQSTHAEDVKNWWEPQPLPNFDYRQLSKAQDSIHINSNRFVTSAGKPVIFRGVNIADPDKLQQQEHWNRKLFQTVAQWRANIVRIPVHPIAWRRLGKTNYFKLLDQAIYWANEFGLYLIIDWHSIGNLKLELFQDPMYDTSYVETLNFWRSIAQRYQNVPTIAFYEIFNEPTTYHGALGQLSWLEWKAMNEEIIGVIQYYDPNALSLIAGLDWAYQLAPVAKAPIEKSNVAYVSHPYPQKVDKPFAPKWQRDFGFIAQQYPLIATEIGYMSAGSPGAHAPVINEGDYGPEIIRYLDSIGASWVAWCFDPDWTPTLIRNWDFVPTDAGQVFRRALEGQVILD